MTRAMLVLLVTVGAVLAVNACGADERESDGSVVGDGDGDGDGDTDSDSDLVPNPDGDVPHVPEGVDCTDDREGCPRGYECACTNLRPQRCACGLPCENNSDCSDPGQPLCCFSTCTDECTCNCF